MVGPGLHSQNMWQIEEGNLLEADKVWLDGGRPCSGYRGRVSVRVAVKLGFEARQRERERACQGHAAN